MIDGTPTLNITQSLCILHLIDLRGLANWRHAVPLRNRMFCQKWFFTPALNQSQIILKSDIARCVFNQILKILLGLGMLISIGIIQTFQTQISQAIWMCGWLYTFGITISKGWQRFIHFLKELIGLFKFFLLNVGIIQTCVHRIIDIILFFKQTQIQRFSLSRLLQFQICIGNGMTYISWHLLRIHIELLSNKQHFFRAITLI